MQNHQLSEKVNSPQSAITNCAESLSDFEPTESDSDSAFEPPSRTVSEKIWNPEADDSASESSDYDDDSDEGDESSIDWNDDVFAEYGLEAEELTDDDCVVDEVRTRAPETPPPTLSEDNSTRPRIDNESQAVLEKILYHPLPCPW
jgi:hypothetical protein